MKNDENAQLSYFESSSCDNNNDATSVYSFSDGSNNFDCKGLKAQSQQYNNQYVVNKNHKSFEIANSLKIEETISSVPSCEFDKLGLKKKQFFTCSQCPKVFSNSSAIAKHKLTHSEERKYVCDICSKTFKRQDHLNGHKHTHMTKKPHACHLCDRSYSDARSLRRHYEGQHQQEFLRCRELRAGADSAGSSVDDSCPVDVFGFLDDARCIKCAVCDKPFKNQSGLNGHMRLHGGYGQTKMEDSRATPRAPPDEAQPGRRSTSSKMSAVPTTVTHSRLHSLLAQKRTSPDSLAHLNTGPSSVLSAALRHSTTTPNQKTEGVCMYMSPCPSNEHHQPPSSSSSSSSASVSGHHPSTACTAIVVAEPGRDHDGNARADVVVTMPEVPYMHPWAQPGLDSVTLSDQWPFCAGPSHRSTPGELDGDVPLPRTSSANNFQDLLMNLDSIDACANLDCDWSKYSSDNNEECSVKEAPLSVVDRPLYSCAETSNNATIVESLLRQSPGPDGTISVPHKKNKNRPAPIFIPPQTSAHMSRLRSPRVWNTSDGKEAKIPPYTPPPMLSPQRKGSGLFNSLNPFSSRTSGNLYSSIQSWSTPSLVGGTNIVNSGTCATLLEGHQISSEVVDQQMMNWGDPCNNSLIVTSRNCEPEHFLYQDDCIECLPQSGEDIDGLPTSATPRINIGAQYQAQLPACRSGEDPRTRQHQQQEEEDRRECDVLLWDPLQFKDTVENISSLDLLMKIASSPAVKSCGLNMEYTFHLLCKYKGDLEKTLQALLENSFVVYDYVYAETTNWTTDEINKFQERLKKHDRDFLQVALDLKSYGMDKSVKACVEFYYVWKQMNNVKDVDRYRLKSSRRKLANDSDCGTINNGDGTTDLQAGDSGYNLRNKIIAGNQKPYMFNSSYDYRTSSDSSSRDPSPAYNRTYKSIPGVIGERIKKSRSYHCTLCRRKFTKPKTLDNHYRNHHSYAAI